jgi:hypothetical protein
MLLQLLGKGQPVALQRGKTVLLFREGGVEMHEADSDGEFFHTGAKTWALADLNGWSPHLCQAFQLASKMGRAWFVLASSPARNRYDRLRKKYYAGIFIMEYFTREEIQALRSVFIATIRFCPAYFLSRIHELDVQQMINYYNKWGPSARTCLRLAWGTISERELKGIVDILAKKFAENPRAVTMESESEEGSHWLFASLPTNAERDASVLRVATPHLRGFVVEAIASIDAARQVAFYSEASGHPYFRSAFGYVFKKFFYIWLSSDPKNEISCTARPGSAVPTRTTRSSKGKSTARDPVELRHLRPVGLDKVIVHGGDAGEKCYKSANEHQTPFAWIPASRSDASFDAVICTDTHIITIQVTVAAKHDIKDKGLESLTNNLPPGFQKDRSWCHVFVTDRNDAAAKLGGKNYPVPDKMKILIHTAVLNISHFQYHPEVLNHATVPSVSRRKLLYNHLGTYLSHQGESDEIDVIEMETDTEEGE